MQEGRGCGGKRINRVNVSLTNKMNNKLSQLAIACNMRPTTLAATLIEMCLEDPVIVSRLQKEHNVHAAYKVIPISRNGETEYMMKG